MKIIYGNEFFLLEEIIKKNFESKYKGSVLGIFWSILQPLMIMIILTIVFSTIFGNGRNYPVYLLCGRCIFTFFTGATSLSINAIKGNKNILKMTSAPKHIFVLGGVFSEFINFLISLILLILVMIATKAPFYLNVLPITIIPIVSVLIMITGIGFILSIICVYYTDIQHLWRVITLTLMYASAIFYPMEIVPEPYYQIIILNPLFWVINQFRELVMYGNIPALSYMVNSLLISFIILVLGIIIFKKYEKKVMMKL